MRSHEEFSELGSRRTFAKYGLEEGVGDFKVYCPTGWDLFLKRVQGVEVQTSPAMLHGAACLSAVAQPVEHANRLIYVKGPADLDGIAASLRGFRPAINLPGSRWQSAFRRMVPGAEDLRLRGTASYDPYLRGRGQATLLRATPSLLRPYPWSASKSSTKRSWA
ncbi:MAG TPA: CRISPR-associated protein Cas4 [Firmicutes bacterium]|nr:CRISPR-associated protein Cas4 [Candidatus Fermentithermobacillaceae bacterium]